MPAAGVPASVAVPSPLSVKVTPEGRLPLSVIVVVAGTPGVVVTVNSDDPPMFGTTLNREYEIAADLLGLDAAGVAGLARTAVQASFAEDGLKKDLSAQIDAYLAENG